MKSLSDLFRITAWDANYQEVGDDVNYAFEEDGSILYIFFQGSNSITDWVRNFLFKAVPFKNIDIKFKVHKGFLNAWKEVEDIVIAKINEKNKKGEYKYKRIIICGYSHGGALSGLCHEVVWYHRPDLRETGLFGYGFESPRFYAGYKVKKELKERWKNYFVIRTNNDLVTHCPPAIFGYCHVGTLIKIKGDTNLESVKAPKCIKSHYPWVVYNALLDYERENTVIDI